MFELKRSQTHQYENLMRELSQIEETLMSENRGLALELMVLEAKIRDRFEQMEQALVEQPLLNEPLDQLSPDDVQALIPFDIPPEKKTRAIETLTVAAVLAVMTALGIFGLVSLLQLALSWFH